MGNEKKTVLLVDDDEDLLEQVRTVAEREFNVDCANSGAEALGNLGKKNYDCIVMDVMMQNLSDEDDPGHYADRRQRTLRLPHPD